MKERNTESNNPAGEKKSLLSFATTRTFMALAVFVALNFALIGLVANRQLPSVEEVLAPESTNSPLARTWSWWVTRLYLAQDKAPDLVIMGSSQMGAATFSSDARTVNKALDCVKDRDGATLKSLLARRLGTDLKVFNWALGGFMASDSYLVAKSMMTGRLKPKVVVIGVNPRDFVDNSLNSASATEPFQFLNKYVELGKLADDAVPDIFARIRWWVEHDMPLRQLKPKNQGVAVAELKKDSNKSLQFLQAISGTGFKVAEGEWVIPARMAPTFMDNTMEYKNRYKDPNPPHYAGQRAFFNEFLALLNAEGIEVLVVGMPSLPPNRALLPDKFWAEWRANLASVCKANNARWVDLTGSDRFVVSDFIDTVHMNADGGDKLFEIIAGELASDKAMVAALLQPDAANRAVAARDSQVTH